MRWMRPVSVNLICRLNAYLLSVASGSEPEDVVSQGTDGRHIIDSKTRGEGLRPCSGKRVCEALRVVPVLT